jgi:hypothetical protein
MTLLTSCRAPCAAQFVREFAKLGLTRSVGGVLGLALSRELTPVVTSIILAGAPPASPSPLLRTTRMHAPPASKGPPGLRRHA